MMDVCVCVCVMYVCVGCTATWCGPCKMMAPIFEAQAEEYKGKMVFVKVDVDDCEV